MLNKKSYINLFICFILLCCDKNTDQNKDIKYINSFYQNNHKTDLSIFYNCLISPRGNLVLDNKNVANLKYIGLYDLSNENLVNLPLPNNLWEWFNFINNRNNKEYNAFLIHKFYSDSLIYFKGFEYISKVILSYYNLKVNANYEYKGIYKVDSNPNIGRYIKFSLRKGVSVYYIPNIILIKNNNWRNFIINQKKLDKSWFYCIGDSCL